MDEKNSKDCLFVGEGVSISGVIQLSGAVRVDGSIDGTVDAGELTVGPTGKITGKVTARIAEIHGEVRESLYVHERVTIHKTGRIEGALSYKSIGVEHGGVVEGKINFLTDAGGTAATAGATKKADAGSGGAGR